MTVPSGQASSPAGSRNRPERASAPQRSSVSASLRPLAAAALLFGLAYAAVFVAFDHGRVTIVAPLYATESLWAVVWSALVLKRAEGVGPRLVLAAVLMVAGGVLIGVSR